MVRYQRDFSDGEGGDSFPLYYTGKKINGGFGKKSQLQEGVNSPSLFSGVFFMSFDNAAQKMLQAKQDSCAHVEQDKTEITPGVIHCWGCGKEWKKC